MSAPVAGDPVCSPRVTQAWEVLSSVLDPEVPALSIRDLGLVRDVFEDTDHAHQLTVVLTPTYCGCPATEVIERSVLDAIAHAGLGVAKVHLQRSPAWSSDWMSESGRRKLSEYGIAPPGGTAHLAPDQSQPVRWLRRTADAVACPRCASALTERLSAFGSTACKALYRCKACQEPFEYFKPL